MQRKKVLTVRIITIAAWVLGAVDLLPWGWSNIPDNVSAFILTVALTGSFMWISRQHSRPVDEVYEAGKAMGRAQLLLEQEFGARAECQERPHLRSVN
jgi:hypothetical protein